ncbi:MAG: MFS transporter [Firmicutes bacterium]|nr:MFS transporter [Alicyclobacillaceae bacterium]MCL6496276.1 MFS transporter [Bacillota bacterium]
MSDASHFGSDAFREEAPPGGAPLPPAATAVPFQAAASLVTAGLLVFLNLYDVQPLLPRLRQVFGAGEAAVSLAIALPVLAVAVSSLVIGPLSDRWGRKRVMVAGTLLIALPTLAAAHAPDLWSFLAARTATGLVIPSVIAVVIAYVNEEYRPPASHVLMSLYVSATVVGGLVGRVGTGLLAAWWGWRAAIATVGWVTLAAGAVLTVALPPSRRFRPNSSWARSFGDLARSFGDPTLLSLGFLGFSYFFAFLSSFTFLTYDLADPPFRLSQIAISLLFFTYLFGVAASPVAGRLSARVGPFPVVGAGLALLIAGTLLTLAPSLPVIVAGLCCVTCGQFTAQALTPALAGQVASHGRGAAGGLYTVLYYLGGAAGSAVPGWIWPRYHYPGVVALDLLCLLGAVGFWNLARRRVALSH